MSLWIKICGNTSLHDAQLAVDAGADAVGFVLAASPRQVTIEQVAKITPELPASVEKIGVFVDAGFDEIESAVQACGLTGAQLHFGADPQLPAKLRQRYGAGLRILRVLHFGADTASQAEALLAGDSIDAVLVDSRTANAVGGTGVAFDWNAAKAQFQNFGAGKKVVIAGGLTPANVAQAIATLRPWGVDVVSGVEAIAGRKDPEKVRDFIQSARNAQIVQK